jgi:hypothetical protein
LKKLSVVRMYRFLFLESTPKHSNLIETTPVGT